MTKALLILALALPALLTLTAQAGTVTATLDIRVTVLASCSVSTQPLTLAPHITGAAQATGTSQAGSIDLRCSKGTAVQIAVDQGPLTGPDGATLAYTLTAPTSAMGQGREVVRLPVQGSVPGGQRAPVGAYAGQAMVRITY